MTTAEQKIKLKGRLMILFFFLLVAFSTFGHAKYLTLNFKSFVFSDMRIAILLWAATSLILMLTLLGEKSALLLSLIEIRRDLAFRHIDVESALQSADIALAGMRLAHVVQDDVSELLRLSEKYNEEENILSTTYDMAIAKLPKKKEDLTQEHKTLISTVKDSSQVHLENALDLFNQFSDKFQRFIRRMQKLSREEEDRESLQKIYAKIEAAIGKSKQIAAENVKKSKKLAKWIE